MAANLLSATADTNIYISGLHFGGEPRRFLNLAEAGAFQLAVSDFILIEIRRVLAYERIGWPEDRINRVTRQIRRYATHVQPAETLEIITADPSDNRILECAAAAQSNYLVTGDQHLLTLQQHVGIRIVKLTEFMKILQSESVEPHQFG